MERGQSFKSLKDAIFISIVGMPNNLHPQNFWFFTDSDVPLYGK